MDRIYYLHFHGASGAGPALAKAIDAELRANPHGAGALVSTPVVMPDADPLPVEQDTRLLLCQIDPAVADTLAPRLDAVARGIPGVRTVDHQSMAAEYIRPAHAGAIPDECISFFVQYNGPSPDPARFHAYYRAHHVPIVERMPGIRTITWCTPRPWTPPPGVRAVDYLQVVHCTFDDIDALVTMRRSGERREGLRDFDNYPPFEGPVTHQCTRTWRIVR